MQREAQEHEEEDRKALERAEARNNLDTLIYSTEKSLKEFSDKVSEKDKANIEEELKKAKEALKSDDIVNIKKATDSLNQAAHKLSEIVYQQTAKSAHSNSSGSSTQNEKDSKTSSSSDGKVYDAEYKVVDDDKK